MKLLAKMVFLAGLCLASMASANELTGVKIEILLLCPPSEEFENFKKVIPNGETQFNSYKEWTQSFVLNMQKMIELVQSGHHANGRFYISSFDARAANPQ